MELDEIKRRLAALQERELMSDFARRSGVNRRTLQRIMLAEDHKQGPHAVTTAAIERTLGQKRFSQATPEPTTDGRRPWPTTSPVSPLRRDGREACHCRRGKGAPSHGNPFREGDRMSDAPIANHKQVCAEMAPPGYVYGGFDAPYYLFRAGYYGIGFTLIQALEEDLTPENLALMARLGVTRA